MVSFFSMKYLKTENNLNYRLLSYKQVVFDLLFDCLATDLWQFTALHEAAQKSRVDVCSLLLAHGADPTLLNCHSKSAIDLAGSRQLQERLAYEYRGHTLLQACRMGDVSRVKKHSDQLLQQFQHPFTLENALHTALSCCPHPQLRKTAEILIKKGVGVNDKSKDGVTPLHIVADRPELYELMESLLKNGALVNATDGNGETRKCKIFIFNQILKFRLDLKQSVLF